ncbi:TonB-dependent receptor [Microbulbifer sp. CAU 1566]|uniref:TonB-dependent receptor domain-containing protein n=1 Tax=Microbulbifer sp. CAU 1566 TaxID=2933269 RepID=UPI0020065B34|nr:TonB-dependent receptor [Microbulbifer sp. CAU 1566]MCK7598579.1 TonB-dependent receptor [Microbulbifer sp. CAU 1566]
MKNSNRFCKKTLAAAVASYALFGVAGAALAQENSDASLEEVVVYGVKQSQQTAINTKRDAKSIVDGIAAEDIGKLPDTTITDSLQRITGVQIQRSAGEGGSLSVRGMQQVAVMLNGEQFLAAGNLANAQPNFTDVPSQLLRSANVYKTLDVSNAVSGITGTIDIETFRPLDFEDGLSTASGYDVSYGEISGEADSTFNALVNWRNDDIGLMVSGVTGQKNLANDYVGHVGDPAGLEMGPGSDFNGSWTVNTNHGYEFFNAENERNRDGINLALQADLGNGLDLVVEGFHTDATEYQRRVGLNLSNRWQGQGNTSADRQAQWHPRYSDPNGWSGAQIAAPTSISDSVTGKDGRNWVVADEFDVEPLWIYSLTSNRKIDTSSTNFNVELNWDNGGPWSGSLRAISATANNDQVYATAQGGINSFRGNTVQTIDNHFYPSDVIERYNLTLDPDKLDQVGVNGGRFVLPNPLGYNEDPRLKMAYRDYQVALSGFDQKIAGGLTDANGEKTLAQYMANKDSWIMEGLQLEQNSNIESDLNAVNLNVNFKPENLFVTDVEFGLRPSRRTVEKENYDYWAQFYVGSDNRLTSPELAAASNEVGCYAQWRSIDQKFDGGGTGAECSAGERLVGAEDDGSSFVPYFTLPPQGLDFHGLGLTFVDDLGDNVSGIPGFWAVDPKSLDNGEGINRKIFGDIKPIVNPGTSYDLTLNELTSYVQSDFEFGNVFGTFGVKVIDSEIQAVIYETTSVTRTNGGSNYYTGRTTETKKRTDVLPSLNLAWNVTDDVMLRFAAAKNKQDLDLDNYGSSRTIFTAADPDDPTQRIPSGWNSSGNINLEPWLTNNFDISAEYYFGDASMLSMGAYLVKIDSFLETQESTIEVDYNGKTYNITGNGPVVGEGGEVKGVELGAKLALSDLTEMNIVRDFGIEANYTYSPSEVPGDHSDVTGMKYPFANNSENTFNFITWYQKDKWQGRVAVNHRSERFIQSYGPLNFAKYAPEETYLDANISYDVLDDVTVYLQGSNLTGEDVREVYRIADGVEQEALIYDNEARYSLGIRAKF